MGSTATRPSVGPVATSSTATAINPTHANVGMVGLVHAVTSASFILAVRMVIACRHGSVFVSEIGVGFSAIRT